MALSKCGKCNNGFFQIVEKEPSGSSYKIMFVQCSSCGTPIGVTDYYNTGSLIKKQEEKIKALESQIKTIDYNIRLIAHKLGL